MAQRFVLRSKTGYDSGHLKPRDHGIIGEFDTMAEVVQARNEHNAKYAKTNDPAIFNYATIIDREDEHAVVGRGYYGNGQRVTSVLPCLSVHASDDVLYRGSKQDCNNFVKSL